MQDIALANTANFSVTALEEVFGQQVFISKSRFIDLQIRICVIVICGG